MGNLVAEQLFARSFAKLNAENRSIPQKGALFNPIHTDSPRLCGYVDRMGLER